MSPRTRARATWAWAGSSVDDLWSADMGAPGGGGATGGGGGGIDPDIVIVCD